MADTIAVLSLKGGTGKTTTVRTLADVLRQVGLDVLTVDLDPQGNLSDYFDVPADAAPTIADVLTGDAKLKEAAHDGIVPSSLNLAEVERTHIIQTLERCGWNHSRAARFVALGRYGVCARLGATVVSAAAAATIIMSVRCLFTVRIVCARRRPGFAGRSAVPTGRATRPRRPAGAG